MLFYYTRAEQANILFLNQSVSVICVRAGRKNRFDRRTNTGVVFHNSKERKRQTIKYHSLSKHRTCRGHKQTNSNQQHSVYRFYAVFYFKFFTWKCSFQKSTFQWKSNISPKTTPKKFQIKDKKPTHDNRACWIVTAKLKNISLIITEEIIEKISPMKILSQGDRFYKL